jgi:hypothetical protein
METKNASETKQDPDEALLDSSTTGRQTKRIVVEIYDKETGRYTKKAFMGRFIVGEANQPENFCFDEADTGISDSGYGAYAVALTAKERLVVLVFDRDGNVISFGRETGSLGCWIRRLRGTQSGDRR